MSRFSWLLVVVVACSGGDDDVPPPPGPLDLSADPDPAERTDCLSSPPSAGEVIAKHVVCDDELTATGPVAHGTIGDILLANERVRFVIRGGDTSATTIGAYSGGIVDAGRHGAYDLIKEIYPVLDLTAPRPREIVVTDAGGDADARVRVVFDLAPIALIATAVPGVSRSVRAEGVVDYELRADEEALRVSVQLTLVDGVAAGAGRPGLLALMGAQELVQPGVGLLGDGGSVGASGRPVLVGEGRSSAMALRFLDEAGSVSQIQSINLVAAGDRINFAAGDVVGFEVRLGVGDHAAAALAAAHADEGWQTFELEASAERAEVIDDSGATLLRTRLADGAVTVAAPDGAYRARAGYSAFFTGDVVDAPFGAVATLPAPPRSILRVEATADGRTDAPVRVTVGEDRYVVVGAGDLALPPGSYDVVVSRGMEHAIHTETVDVADGETVVVTADLPRVVDTAGWVAGDFHLHTELSTDSRHGMIDKLAQIAAEGLEVVASLDHDHISDYAPHLEAAGVAGWLTVVGGVESSPTSFGHVGGYPLRRDVADNAGGAPVWFDMAPGELFDALRARGDDSLGGAIVQLNHPRLGDAGFFTAVGLDRDTGLATASPADLGLPGGTDLSDFDFDVIEVWNGLGGDEEAVFEDWLALTALGRSYTMVGNSDSHEAAVEPGSPRTFIQVVDDSPGAFDWPEVAASLRAGAVTVSAGIFVTAEATGPIAGGTVPIAVRVQAPDWIDVTRLRIYAGRDVAVDRPVDTPRAEAVRVDETIDVPVSGPGFVVVRADGTERPQPILRYVPYGVTNAIEVE